MSQLSLFDSALPKAGSPRAADAYGHALSPEQAVVRDAGLGHRVVVAGAGTGKTELLTQRVLKLLLEGAGESSPLQGEVSLSQEKPAELEGVVALTFTNKAAAEMRSRVYRALVRRLRASDDALERARLGRLRAEFSSRNRIWTFDSLAATILRLFPEHSPLPRGAQLPTAGQERALEQTLGRQFWAWIGLGDEEEAESLFEFLEMFERRENALGAIRDAARRDASDLERLALLPDFWEFARELLALAGGRVEALWAAHVARVGALERISLPARTSLLDPQTARLPHNAGGFLTQSGFSAPFKKRLGEEVSPSQQLDLSARLLDWRAQSEELDARREALELLGEDLPREGQWEREWRGRRAVASLARYALWWQGSERALKDERKLADFHDISRAALRVLETSDAGEELRREIEWLLVDEFQDTNPSQWRVVQALRRRAPDAGNALLVGDPKQAIYDFRGGDIRVFDAGRKTLEREGAASSVLSISRRSAPPLVEWTNRAFAAIFPLENAPREAFEAAHGPLSPVPEAWAKPRAFGDEPGVYVLNPPSWHAGTSEMPAKKLLTEALRQKAAHALSSWLLELLDDARLPPETFSRQGEEFPRPTETLRQPAFSSVSRAMREGQPSVAVLFADNSVKGVFETILRARGVPFVGIRGKGFFRCDAVRWSVSLWRAMLDGDDEAAMIGLLRSPLGGQSDFALLERRVARASGEESWLPSETFDAATFAALRERLASWRALGGALPVSAVMERVLGESELAWFEERCEDAAQRRENWVKVLDLVREREEEGEGGLRALVDFFEAHADDDAEPLAPLPSGGAIQLMTVHASKGLGFPCVVLAQLESPKREGADKTLLWGELDGQTTAAFGFGREREDEAQGKTKAAPPLAFELLKRDASARALAEWKRLFYVACTRAQSHLVLLQTDGNPPASSWGALSGAARQGLNEARPSPLPPLKADAFSQPDSPAPWRLESAPPAPLPVQLPRERRFDELWGERGESSVAAERAWVERRLRDLGGNAASIRQDVPFCARGRAFDAPCEWIIGAWPWLAALPDGDFLLVATGTFPDQARQRARVFREIALQAGLSIVHCHALWKGENGVLEEVTMSGGP